MFNWNWSHLFLPRIQCFIMFFCADTWANGWPRLTTANLPLTCLLLPFCFTFIGHFIGSHFILIFYHFNKWLILFSIIHVFVVIMNTSSMFHLDEMFCFLCFVYVSLLCVGTGGVRLESKGTNNQQTLKRESQSLTSVSPPLIYVFIVPLHFSSS